MHIKLSNRLQTVLSLITKRYDNIYDLCCDHGLLGKVIVQDKSSLFDRLYFVDRVASITSYLNDTYIPRPENVKIINQNILDLKTKNGFKNLYLMCGIGADLCINMLTKLEHEDHNWEIILSPHQNTIKLRNYLAQHNYSLINESLIKEKNHFYEVIHVKHHCEIATETVKTYGLFSTSVKNDVVEYYQQQIEYLNIVLRHQKISSLKILRNSYLTLLKNAGK